MLPKLGKLKLNGYTLDLDEYLKRDYDDIATACEELPPIIEWVNSQLQSLHEQKMLKQHELRVVEAKAYFSLKDGEFERLGYAGSMTEKSIDHAMALNPDIDRVTRELAVLSGWVGRLNNLTNSLQNKLELIRSTESTRRKVFAVKENET